MSISGFNPEYFFPTLITSITQLNGGIFGTVKGTDIYAAVDVTDVTQSPTGTTKPYQILQLVNYILGNFGFSVYQPVLATTTTNLTATYNNGLSGVGATLTNAGAQAAFTIDGQTGVLNGRYLIAGQTSQFQNGIYILSDIGSLTSNWILTRAQDFNQSSNIIDGGIVYSINGNTFANTYWQDTFTSPLTVGTSAIVWTEFSISPSQLIWHDITSNSVNGSVNEGYIADNASTRVEVLLPATFNIGDTVIVLGKGAAGWSLAANTGQTIQFGSIVTSPSGAINSDFQYANIQVRGLVANTVWEVTSVLGNPTII